MHLIRTLCLLGIAAKAAFAITNVTVIDGAYIVEFEESQTSVDTFYNNLTSNGIPAVPRRSFGADGIFIGASFHLSETNLSHVDIIGNFTQVKSITPVRRYERLAPVKSQVVRGVNKVLHRRAQNISMPSHSMTGVDKLHAEGLDGKGLKIAIVDTGIDYTHPALGGGFGPGYKVAFGTDLVGDDYPFAPPAPDSDPIDCAGHGTHVAGIIGASNDQYVLGVAPAATLGIYKVFGCTGGVDNDILIQAFIMAYEAGADIITASIGGVNGWSEEPWAVVISNIVAKGTPCTVAAGNDGDAGMFYASSGSSGHDVTAVGSVDSTYVPALLVKATYTIDGGAPQDFGYFLADGDFTAAGKLTVVADNFDLTKTDDGCTSFKADATNKIALIRRGTCTFDTKVANALAAGAKYVMLYNNQPSDFTPSVTDQNVVGVGMISGTLGGSFINALSAGKTIEFQFTTDIEPFIVSPGAPNNATGGSMSVFTTWGLTNEADIKPVVSAPGGNILSTYPVKLGSYAVESGTSMATPFVAGTIALFLQSSKTKVDPKLINAALASSATPLKWNDGTSSYGFLASVAQQGSGLLNAYQMVHSSVSILKPSLLLNDTANFVTSPDFYVQNNGKTTQTYTLTHVPASNAYAFPATRDEDTMAVFPPPLDQKYSSVTFTPQTFTVKPGEKYHVYVHITPDSSLNSVQIPVYSGFIKVSSDGSTDVAHVPYAGIATKMNSVPVWGDKGWFNYDIPPFKYNYTGPGNINGTIPGFKPSVTGNFPTYYMNNVVASKLIRADIVALRANITNKVSAANLQTVGSVPGFPLALVERLKYDYFLGAPFNGTLADGSVVPSGVYQMHIRGATTYANVNRGAEYNVKLSSPFYLDMS